MCMDSFNLNVLCFTLLRLLCFLNRQKINKMVPEFKQDIVNEHQFSSRIKFWCSTRNILIPLINGVYRIQNVTLYYNKNVMVKLISQCKQCKNTEWTAHIIIIIVVFLSVTHNLKIWLIYKAMNTKLKFNYHHIFYRHIMSPKH